MVGGKVMAKIKHKSSIKKSFGERIFDIINYTILTLLSLCMLYPMYYVLVASFSDANEMIINADKLLLYPLKPNAAAYKYVLDYPMIWRGYLNTIFVVVVGTTINMILSIFGAYFMSIHDKLPGKKFFIKFVLVTMFFNGGMIPTYMVVKVVGLLDSIWSVILPTAISTYNMIVIRSAMAAIPKSLSEAAEIDGANDFVILWKIIVPTCVPTIAVVIMYYAVAHWNAWFNAFIYITGDRTKWPLQVVLRRILIEGTEMAGDTGGDSQTLGETIKYAVIMVSTVPILMVYPLIQKHLIKGVMLGSVKG